MNKKFFSIVLSIISMVVTSIPAFTNPGISISSLVQGETISGSFILKGSVLDNTGVDGVFVKIGNGPWTKASGVDSWDCPVDYRKLVIKSEYRFDPVTGKYTNVYVRGPYYGDIKIQAGAFDAKGKPVEITERSISIIPEAPVSDTNSGWYGDNVTISLSSYTELDVYYTLDGRDPAMYGIFYSGSLLLSDTTTVRAVAKSENRYVSQELTRQINIDKTAAPAFAIGYFSDSNFTSSLGENPYLKDGTYYIKITSNKQLRSSPTISINAEGTANDTTNANTIHVSGNDYLYARVIVQDALAVGNIPEDTAITGTDMIGKSSIEVDPTNELSDAAYTDTIAPSSGSIAIPDISGYTNDPTPVLSLFSAGASHMRFALSEAGLPTAPWIPYAPSYEDFDISSGGYGTKTVWVEYRDLAWNIQSVHANDSTIYDSSALSFDIQYFADAALTVSLGSNPYLKAGTYYLKITANKPLGSNPFVVINAEGTNNDVGSGSTIFIVENRYRYDRIIVSDPLSAGSVLENISINGIAPSDLSTKAAYTDTIPPAVPIVEGTSPTNDTTPKWDWNDVAGATKYRYGYSQGTWISETEILSDFTPATGLLDGDYTLFVQAGDAAGNWSGSGSFTISIDATPPAPPVVTGTTPTNDTTPKWDWDDVSGATKYRYGYTDGIWITESAIVSEYTPETPLSEGSYTLYVQACDAAGNWSASGSLLLMIDTTPPAIPLVTGTTPTNDTTPKWDWNDVTGATKYRYGYTDGAWITTSATESDFTPDTPLSDGDYTLYVQAGDAAGNWSASGTYTITIDTTPPDIPVITGVTPTNDTTPIWNWNDVSGATKYRYGYFPENWIIETAIVSEFTPESALAQGVYTLFVQAGDAAGNWSASGSFSITISTDTPDQPVVTGITPTNDKTPTWIWNDVTTAKYRYGYSEGIWITESATTSDFTPDTPLSDGDYTLYVQAGDAAGNWSASGTYTITIDTTPPDIPVITGVTPTNDTTPIWNWNDVTGATKYRYGYTDGIWITESAVISEFIPESNLEQGNYTLYVQSSDILDNWSESGSLIITIDTEAPTQALITGITPTNDTTPKWDWDDVTGAVKYRYGYTDGIWITESATASDFTPGTSLSEGDYTLYVQAGDAAGNWSSSGSFLITIDATPPGIPLVTGITPTNDTTPRWDWNDVAGATKYRYGYSIGAWITQTATVSEFTPGSILWQTTNRLYVQAGDEAGNWSASGSFTITIDTNPPGVPSVTGTTPTNDTTPRWDWNDVTEAIKYRYGYTDGIWITESATASEYTPDTPLAEGSYKLYVQAGDAAGNWSSSGSFLIAIDTTPPGVPSVTGTSPTNDTTPTWDWNDVTGAAKYRYGYTEGIWITESTKVSNFMPATPLPEGAITLYVQAGDTVGNWSVSGTFIITIDTTPPDIPSVSGTSPTRDTTPTWDWNDVPDVLCYRYGYSESVWITQTETLSEFTPGSSLGQGLRTLYVQARDAAGNWSSSGSFVISIDFTPPVVNAGPDVAWTNAPTELNGSATDTNGIVSYLWECTSNFSYSKNEGFEKGSFETGWTTGGNSGWSVLNTTFHTGTYGARSGTITHSQETHLELSYNLSVSGNITFYYKVSSESGYDYLRFYIDDVLKSSWSGNVNWTQGTFAVTSGNHIFKWVYTKDSSASSGSDCAWIDDVGLPGVNTIRFDDPSLPNAVAHGDDNREGSYVLRLSAIDAAGNAGSDALIFNWDTLIPTALLLNTPPSATYSKYIDITVGGNGVVAYKYKLDSGAWSSETGSTTHIIESSLAEGSHSVYAIGRDAAGNWQPEGNATACTWTVDSIPPSAPQVYVKQFKDWHWQNPLPQGNDLNSIFFVDEETGWAAGDKGTIIRTTDKGQTWVLVDTGMSDIASIYFYDANNGWATTGYGSIIRTNDGGITWTSHNSHASSLSSIYFRDATTGWAVGAWGTVVNTTDGGTTWQSQVSGTTKTLNSVEFTDSNNGYACGTTGTLLYSSNGGTTWNTYNTGTTEDLYDIDFIDSNTGWIIGHNGIMLKTIDGGLTWQLHTNGTTWDLESVHFFDNQYGWAGGLNGVVGYTKDGGDTWIFPQSSTGATIESIFFVSRNKGWAVGRHINDAYGLFTTDDGSKTWSTVLSGPVSAVFLDACFANENKGWACTSEGDILSTIDGGKTWDTQFHADNFSDFHSICNTDANNIWACGWDSIIHSADGGIHWEAQQQPGNRLTLFSIYFIDNNIGWAVGSSGTIINTTDGGDTWTLKPSDLSTSFYSVYFSDPYHGWIAGGAGKILHTIDGGLTWQEQISGRTDTINSIYFTDMNTGWIAGSWGKVSNTTDGGATWGLQGTSSYNLEDIYFIDNNTGWAIGSYGLLLTTINGGQTWIVEETNTIVHLNSVYFADKDTGWITGIGGTILHKNSMIMHDMETTEDKVSIITTGETGTTFNKSTTLNGISYSWPANDTFIDSGSYVITITQTDSAGNVSQGTQFSFTLNPVFSIQYYSDPALTRSLGNNPHFKAGTYYLKIISDKALATNPIISINTDGTSNDVSNAFATKINSRVFKYTRTIIADEGIAGAVIEDISIDGFDPSDETKRAAYIDFVTPPTPLITAQAVSKWDHLNPQPTGETLNSVWFIDQTTGWAVGNHGVLLKSTNGGQAWTVIDSGVSVNLNDICFMDSANGWIVGDLGTLLKTADSGATWTSVDCGTLYNFNKIQFPDTDNGWIVGLYITLKTTNGGKTWTSFSELETYGTALYFISRDIGWIADWNRIYYTNNGGITWTLQTTNTTNIIEDIWFIDANKGWAVGDNGAIITTSDGGVTWTVQVSGATTDYYSVQFIDESVGYIMSTSGGLLYTSNGGAIWSSLSINVGSYSTLSNIHFLDANHGWAVGYEGANVYTVNGGLTWLSGRQGFTEDLLCVSAADENNVWAVGYHNIYHSGDGGTTWTKQTTGTTNWLIEVCFLRGSGMGWISCDNGTILHTTDGGINWIRQNSGNNNSLEAIHFIDEQHGWACGYNGTIVHSIDGGAHWQAQTSGVTSTFYSIYFIDAVHGWAVGANGQIIATTDGGVNWFTQTSGITGYLFGVYFKDINRGWAVGDYGTILHTENGGATWTRLNSNTSNTLYSISFISENEAIAVSWGNIAKSIDGGLTWTRESLTGNSIRHITSSSGKAWIAGDSGTIMKYTPTKQLIEAETTDRNVEVVLSGEPNAVFNFSATKDAVPYPWPNRNIFKESGIYVITASQTDRAGNTSMEITFTFTIQE